MRIQGHTVIRETQTGLVCARHRRVGIHSALPSANAGTKPTPCASSHETRPPASSCYVSPNAVTTYSTYDFLPLYFLLHAVCPLCYDGIAHTHGGQAPGRQDTEWTLSRWWIRGSPSYTRGVARAPCSTRTDRTGDCLPYTTEGGRPHDG
jgi:hypothetical protein